MIALLLACALPSEASDLYGLWSSEEPETIRVLEFWEERGYAIYNYPPGDAPIVVQLGEYAMVDGTLVTRSEEGVDYANEVVAWRRDRFLELEVDPETGATRRFEYTDSLP